jgi:hypothetical protein
MDNVQKHNTCINVPLSQTFRSYLALVYFLTEVNINEYYLLIWHPVITMKSESMKIP